jgi:hypothetical protein
MPSLQEVYREAVELGGEDSPAAIALKAQMEAFEKPSSAERHFIAGGRPLDTSEPPTE